MYGLSVASAPFGLTHWLSEKNTRSRVFRVRVGTAYRRAVRFIVMPDGPSMAKVAP